MNPRALAAKILSDVIKNGHSLPLSLRERGEGKDLPLIKELCYGTLRWYFRLVWLLNKNLSKPLKDKDADVHALLLIGLYQLIFLRIPDHAAVTETVEAARDLKKPWAAALINAVLREFLRHPEINIPKEQLSAYYAHPQWLIERIRRAWPQNWQAILEANNQHPPFCLRINALQTTRESYLAALKEWGIEAHGSMHAPQAIYLAPCDVTQLPGFAEGQFCVQDSAAQLAAGLLELKEDLRVLDACAAPGGKTTHLMEMQPNLAEIVAIDASSERLSKAKENWERLRLPDRVRWVVADAKNTAQWWDGQLFDRILLDAPCSATGVIRRHPDIKLLRKPQDLDGRLPGSFPDQQLTLLNALWPLLKPGGLLLYATCSVLPEENALLLERFLGEHADAVEEKILADWGVACTVGRQIFPEEGGVDGFYYGRLGKAFK